MFRHNQGDKPVHICGDELLVQSQLSRWFRDEPGCDFARAEKIQLETELANLFGFHLLQMGELGEEDLLTSSRVSHRHIMRLAEEPGSPHFSLRAESDSLPVQTDSIDIVLLPHTLDFSLNPHQVLREVERVLIPEGHVVISGFNPFSIWQLWRWVLRWRKSPPWCGKFFTPFRIKDWLKLLGFDVMSCHYFYYRPPLKRASIMKRLGWLDKLGSKLWPVTGAGYVLVARKRVETLTPIRPRWVRSSNKVVSPGFVESRTSYKN